MLEALGLSPSTAKRRKGRKKRRKEKDFCI
jgi:hypothetical protein